MKSKLFILSIMVLIALGIYGQIHMLYEMKESGYNQGYKEGFAAGKTNASVIVISYGYGMYISERPLTQEERYKVFNSTMFTSATGYILNTSKSIKQEQLKIAIGQ